MNMKRKDFIPKKELKMENGLMLEGKGWMKQLLFKTECKSFHSIINVRLCFLLNPL